MSMLTMTSLDSTYRLKYHWEPTWDERFIWYLGSCAFLQPLGHTCKVWVDV